ASGKAELILAESSLGPASGVFKEVGSVEMVVAEKFPSRAVKFVGAGLDGGVEHRGSGAAEFRAEVRGLHLKFLDGVDRGKHDKVGAVKEVHGVGVIVDAVE